MATKLKNREPTPGGMGHPTVSGASGRKTPACGGESRSVREKKARGDRTSSARIMHPKGLCHRSAPFGREHVMRFSKIRAISAVSLAGILVWSAGVQAQVVMEMVTIGNPGNEPDTRYETPGYGGVDYVYEIGKYEVTAGQYTEFLNAVADEDTYGLYNADMWSGGF